MKLVTYTTPGGRPEAGVLAGDRVVSLTSAGFADTISVLAAWPEVRERIERVVADASGALPVSLVKLLAPIPNPPKVICVGLNYRDHVVEAGMDLPKAPAIFSKFSNTVIGPGDNIVLPRNSTKPDYEAELAFVIGKGGRHIPADRWRDHVFGYTVFHDVSARDFQMATSQWLMGKTFPTFAPMGPALVSTDEIADPHTLDISLTINGEVLQNSNTRELIFKIPELVEYISSVVLLEPGDVVATGTPPGVGFARKPPRFLRPGDEVTIRIAGLGELTNPVVAET